MAARPDSAELFQSAGPFSYQGKRSLLVGAPGGNRTKTKGATYAASVDSGSSDVPPHRLSATARPGLRRT